MFLTDLSGISLLAGSGQTKEFKIDLQNSRQAEVPPFDPLLIPLGLLDSLLAKQKMFTRLLHFLKKATDPTLSV